jgi:hypothetical protein
MLFACEFVLFCSITQRPPQNLLPFPLATVTTAAAVLLAAAAAAAACAC